MDGSVVSIGTANMDIRSFSLNFEVNAFIFDEGKAKECEGDFMNDLKDSVEVTQQMFESRPKSVRIAESLVRLVSPIL